MVTMDNIIEYANGKSVQRGAFAITFDDGFDNNLSVAAPVLKKHLVPAIFYVTTNFVSNNLMSWIDRIDWSIESIPDNREYNVEVPWLSVPKKLYSFSDKLHFLKEVRRVVKSDSTIDQHMLADSLQDQLGLPRTISGFSELDLKLSWEGLRSLEECELFTIGGHTHNHPIMTFLSASGLSDEIETCLNLLESKANITTNHFAYPEGLSHCYNDKVISCLKQFGIECCLTAETGTNDITLGSDLFRLKRIFVE
mgnify:CR=1 FL=1